MTDKPQGGPTDAGKGWAPRKVDRIKWEEYWKRCCLEQGHIFNVNNICVYCGKGKDDRQRND